MRRFLYLGYYLKNLDLKKYILFLNHAHKELGKSRLWLTVDVIYSSLRYNISFLEYFQFYFYKLEKSVRKSFAGTGFMYEYQLKMNPRNKRGILDDKNSFNKLYESFLLHQSYSLEDLQSNLDYAQKVIDNPSGKMVLKVSNGKCGANVEIHVCEKFSKESLIDYMVEKNYDLVEEFIIQHPDIMRMSPSAVNTIRIFTQLIDRDEVIILGCRFRISIDSPVDNLAAGNIAAPIEEATGTVMGPGVYSDITKKPEVIHPITGVKIPGFKIPFWKESLELAINAAKAHPQNKSIGWDIVITENGPGLIEGNHDWCKLVWQLPVKKGLKPRIEKYLK